MYGPGYGIMNVSTNVIAYRNNHNRLFIEKHDSVSEVNYITSRYAICFIEVELISFRYRKSISNDAVS